MRISTAETVRLPDGRTLLARGWAGSGPVTVVVLHGLLDSSEGWSCLSEHLTCPVLALDLPGFGHSDAPRRGSVGGYAQDVAEAVTQLGVERFVLVGHSLGGAVATALAELIPDRVSSLLLLAPAGFGPIHLAELISVPVVREVVQAALPLVLSSRLAVTAGYITMVANGRRPEPEVVERVTSRGGGLVDGAREGTRAVVNAGRRADAFHRRQVAYSGPVHVVWGDQDRLVPVAHARAVAGALPQSRIDIWPSMGHHPLRERFEDLLRVIGDAVTAAAAGMLPAALSEPQSEAA